MRLTRAMLYVKDLPRMTAFYADTLGMKPIEETRSETWVEFDTGTANFALHAIPPHIASQIEILSPPQPREQSPMKLTFEVADVTTERKKLEARGVTFVQRPWGAYEGIDPEGNIFGLSTYES